MPEKKQAQILKVKPGKIQAIRLFELVHFDSYEQSRREP
jgi:hypothetical protein